MSERSGIRRILRLRRLTERDSVEETDEEIRLHVELRAAELVDAGLGEEAARAEAWRRFARDEDTLRGLYTAARGRDSRMRLRVRAESVMQDVRYAARGLMRNPVPSTFVVVTLALGIGANVTAWSLFDRLLLRDPAHVVEADRVMRLFAATDSEPVGTRTSPWMPFSAYRQFRELGSFESVAAYRVVDRWVGESVDARRMRVGEVLGPFFPLLGVRGHSGRVFGADDAAVTGDVAVVGHEFWQSGLGGDPGVVGRRLVIESVPYTVVGVAPPGFNGIEPRRVAAWVLGREAAAGNRNWQMLGRLRPGVTKEAASAEATLRHVPDASGPFAWFRDARIFAAPWSWDDTGREAIEATLARWLAAITGIILLIAFANVVSLLLVRVARRRRELAIRVSLGSGRGRVVRLIAMEGALLALAGGVASLLVARVAEPLLRRALFADQAGWTFEIADARILALVAVIVVLTMVCVGTVPAIQAGSARIAGALHGGPRSGSANPRMREVLTVVQAALSVVLLAGAGLFLRSFANVRALDLGIDRDRVLTVDVTLPSWRSFESGTYSGFIDMERQVFRRLEERVAGVQGVASVAIAVGLPLDGGSFSATAFVSGRDSIPALPGGGPWVSAVSARYFEAIGTRIVRGRPFADADREGSEPVVIINETMARTLWPGGEAIGECIRIGEPTNPCARIIGIAEDVHRTGLREQPSFQYYVPVGQQSTFGGARLVVRPGSQALSADLLRRAIVEAEPAVLGIEIRPLDESLAGELRPLRIGLLTFGISGALALVVVVLGLYSLMSYLVTWRTHEIGMRVALGATHGRITRLVLRSGLTLATAGAILGLGLALFAGRWLEPHLFRTSPRDGLVLAAVALILIATALAAGTVPARRAASLSPADALRSE